MHQCQFQLVGGTGIPKYPPRKFGAIAGDGISKDHDIEFCYPTPGIRFYGFDEEPPRSGCGDFTRNMDNFPLNQASTYENGYWTFGQSEMVLVYVRIYNY